MREIKFSTSSPAMNTLFGQHRPMLFVALLVVALALTACGRRPVPPEVETTPATGGVEAPSEGEEADNEEASDEAATESATESASEDSSEAAGEDDPSADVEAEAALVQGMVVVIADENGTRIYADADADAPVLNLFSAGEVMELLAPSGDYDDYPVNSGDQAWLRVRAVDGLVGWVMADAVEAAE